MRDARKTGSRLAGRVGESESVFVDGERRTDRLPRDAQRSRKSPTQAAPRWSLSLPLTRTPSAPRWPRRPREPQTLATSQQHQQRARAAVTGRGRSEGQHVLGQRPPG